MKTALVSTSFFIGFLFFFSSITSFSQTPKTIEVSRQDFSTRIRSSAFGDDEKVYYGGNFKGALTINGDTLMLGKGNNDLFVVKTDSTGAPLWHLNIGSDQDESSSIIMHYQNNGLYLMFSVSYPFTIGNTSVNDITPGESTGILTKIDNNGNVLWVKKTNCSIVKIHPGNLRIVLEATINRTAPTAMYGNQIVFAPNGFANQLFISIDENGNYIKTNNIYQNYSLANSVSLNSIADLPNNRYYFLIATATNSANPGNNRYFIGDTSVLLPSVSQNILLIKTDSSFNLLKSKVFNPSGGNILTNTNDANRFRLSEGGEKLNFLASGGTYNADGYNLTFNNSFNLLSLDTSLVTISVKKIAQNSIFPPIRTQRIHFVEEDAEGYTIFGTVEGSNGSFSSYQIPDQLIEFSITESFKQTFNLNGPSQTYLLRTNKNLEVNNFKWVGSTSIYEIPLPIISELKKRSNHSYFLNLLDDTWAPWKVSKNLLVKYGGYKRNANGPDYSENAGFFSDKSTYVIGTASGQNVFDTNNTEITAAFNRRDVFFAMLNENGSTKKYHRISSSFSRNSISRVRMMNDTLYVLATFADSKNQANATFFKVDTISRFINGVTHKALFKIDKTGGVQYLDFQYTPIGIISDFDVYENGDIAVLSLNSTKSLNLNGNVFPATNGFYLAKLNPSGIVKEAVKVSAAGLLATLEPLKMQLEKKQETAGLLLRASYSGNLPELQMVHSRNGNQETIKSIANPLPNEVNIKFYLISYRLSMTNNLEAGIAGPVNLQAWSGFVSDGKTNILFFENPTTETIKYNQTELHSTSSPNASSFIIALDSNLQYKKHLSFISVPNGLYMPFRIFSAKSINNNFYFSGNQWQEISSGALKILHKGNGDGLTLKIDSSLNIIQFFKIATPYSEFITDFSIHSDSTFMVGYRSQTKPEIKVGLNSAGLFETNTSLIKPFDYAEKGFVSLYPSANYPKDFIYSIKNGNWSEPTTWSTGKVPGSTDQVFIRHKVIVDVPATCFTVYADSSGSLQLNTGIQLQITGVAQE